MFIRNLKLINESSKVYYMQFVIYYCKLPWKATRNRSERDREMERVT